MIADEVEVYCDDEGWHLRIIGGQNLDVRLLDPQQLAEQARQISEWYAEGEREARLYAPPIEEDAFAPDDPKHPDYLALADKLRGRAKEVSRGLGR